MESYLADYTKRCQVQLCINDEEISGLFYTSKTCKMILQGFFENSVDKQVREINGEKFLTAEIDPADMRFQQFMLKESTDYSKQNEELYKTNGFYEQTCDFYEIWKDNDVEKVLITFPVLPSTKAEVSETE